MDLLRGRTPLRALREELSAMTRTIVGRGRTTPIAPPHLSEHPGSAPGDDRADDQMHVDAVPRLDRPRS